MYKIFLKKLFLKNNNVIWLLSQIIPFFIIFFIAANEEELLINAIFIVAHTFFIFLGLHGFVMGFQEFKKVLDLHLIEKLSYVNKAFLVFLFYVLLLYKGFYLSVVLSIVSFILAFFRTFIIENVISTSASTFIKELDNDDIIISNHFEKDLILFNLSKYLIPLLFVLIFVIPLLNFHSVSGPDGNESLRYLFKLLVYLFYQLV
jgi:hypothetical protein